MKPLILFAFAAAFALPSLSMAASCGNTSSSFEAWKADFSKTAKKKGVKNGPKKVQKPGLEGYYLQVLFLTPF